MKIDAANTSDPVTFRRVDYPWEDVDARYRLDCESCNLRAESRSPRRFVQRYDGVAATEPVRQPGMSDSTWAVILMVDDASGAAEIRARDREVDTIERQIEERLRAQLRATGCSHARPGAN